MLSVLIGIIASFFLPAHSGRGRVEAAEELHQQRVYEVVDLDVRIDAAQLSREILVDHYGASGWPTFVASGGVIALPRRAGGRLTSHRRCFRHRLRFRYRSRCGNPHC
jgi:hypothetical protein